MKSKIEAGNADARQDQSDEHSRGEKSPERAPDPFETPLESDESSDLDESDLRNADDDRWDVFILDDDCEPLPDYGDFWLPD